MNQQQATRLALRLAAAFPSAAITPDVVALRAEKMRAWELAAAERAVETLIDHGRMFPTVAELREAYAGAGGKIADPARDMSPPRRHQRDVSPATPEQVQAAIRKVDEAVALYRERRRRRGV